GVAFLLPLARADDFLRQHREGGLVEEGPLRDAVLERVIRDHDDAATGSEDTRRPRQRGGELLKLPVDRDTERLERAASGVGGPRPPADRAGDDSDELVGALDGPGGPGPNDRVRDPPCVALLSEVPEEPEEVLLRDPV